MYIYIGKQRNNIQEPMLEFKKKSAFVVINLNSVEQCRVSVEEIPDVKGQSEPGKPIINPVDNSYKKRITIEYTVNGLAKTIEFAMLNEKVVDFVSQIEDAIIDSFSGTQKGCINLNDFDEYIEWDDSHVF